MPLTYEASGEFDECAVLSEKDRPHPSPLPQEREYRKGRASLANALSCRRGVGRARFHAAQTPVKSQRLVA
jgi:hypothetical protein